jgi:cysteine dioxygenase
MKEGDITSVHELVRQLVEQRSPATYGAVLERFVMDTHELSAYCRWNRRHYTRTCIHRDANFELLLICYGPGQSTSVHDYGSQTAWIHPIMGEVIEERFKLTPDGTLRCISEIHLFPGQRDHITNGNSIHRFTNRGVEGAITLNLYARPVCSWKLYDVRTGASHVVPAGPPR